MANGEEAFYHDLPPSLAKYHASLLRTQFQLYVLLYRDVKVVTDDSSAGSEPLTYEAYKDIPAAFLYCDDDRAFPIERQRNVVKAAGIQRTMSLNTSHSPFLSDPDRVVDFIIELAKDGPSTSHL